MDLVLLIEDEPVLRSSMARAIAKLPGVEVADVGTVSAALVVIDARPPTMIVSDIDLPDRSGIELVGELGRRSLQIPILFVSGYLKAYGAQIPPHANVDVREKPVQLEELRAIVQSRLGHSMRAVEHAPFAVADYVQLACIGRHSVVIDVESGGENGRIIINNGLVWTAVDPKGDGVEAFRRLAFARDAVTRVRTLREDPGPQTMFGSWESVLLNAARIEDEETRDSLIETEQAEWFHGEPERAPETARSLHSPASPEPSPSVDVIGPPSPNQAPPASGVNSSLQHVVSGPLTQNASSLPNAQSTQSTRKAGELAPPLPPSKSEGHSPSGAPMSRPGFVWSLEPTPTPGAAQEKPAYSSVVAAASSGSPGSAEPEEGADDTAFNNAWDEGIAALLMKDYQAALAAFKAAEALRPDDPKVKTNLKRLREMGFGESAVGE